MNPVRQSFLFTQKEEFGAVTKEVYLIEHLNKQNLPRPMGFSNGQAITYQGRIFAFADWPEVERNDRINVSKRDLVSFDGSEWTIFA